MKKSKRSPDPESTPQSCTLWAPKQITEEGLAAALDYIGKEVKVLLMSLQRTEKKNVSVSTCFLVALLHRFICLSWAAFLCFLSLLAFNAFFPFLGATSQKPAFPVLLATQASTLLSCLAEPTIPPSEAHGTIAIYNTKNIYSGPTVLSTTSIIPLPHQPPSHFSLRHPNQPHPTHASDMLSMRSCNSSAVASTQAASNVPQRSARGLGRLKLGVFSGFVWRCSCWNLVGLCVFSYVFSRSLNQKPCFSQSHGQVGRLRLSPIAAGQHSHQAHHQHILDALETAQHLPQTILCWLLAHL